MSVTDIACDLCNTRETVHHLCNDCFVRIGAKNIQIGKVLKLDNETPFDIEEAFTIMNELRKQLAYQPGDSHPAVGFLLMEARKFISEYYPSLIENDL